MSDDITQPIVPEEHWIKAFWRPAMGITYIIINLFDFVIAPTLVMIFNTFFHSSLPAWQSLTLSNGGLVHIAFGGVLGVAAYGRTQEKLQLGTGNVGN